MPLIAGVGQFQQLPFPLNMSRRMFVNWHFQAICVQREATRRHNRATGNRTLHYGTTSRNVFPKLFSKCDSSSSSQSLCFIVFRKSFFKRGNIVCLLHICGFIRYCFPLHPLPQVEPRIKRGKILGMHTAVRFGCNLPSAHSSH